MDLVDTSRSPRKEAQIYRMDTRGIAKCVAEYIKCPSIDLWSEVLFRTEQLQVE
jgi:hypothetical protein